MDLSKWRVVPCEPAQAMDAAGVGVGCEQHSHAQHCAEVYEAMLAAAPTIDAPTLIDSAELAALRQRLAEAERDVRAFKGSAIPCCTSIDPRGYQWCEAYLDAAMEKKS